MSIRRVMGELAELKESEVGRGGACAGSSVNACMEGRRDARTELLTEPTRQEITA